MALNDTNSQDSNDSANFDAIKGRLKSNRSDGDYETFSRHLAEAAERVLVSWRIHPRQQVLDVACGCGQTAIPCAKHGAMVSATDIADTTIEASHERAALEGVTEDFHIGDAEQTPYDNTGFDVVISMFAPRPGMVIEEFAPVCKPGDLLTINSKGS